MLHVAALSLALPGASCATPQTRIRTALLDAGLSPRMSACMAERMAQHLSLFQLRRLSSLGGLKGRPLRELPFDEFLHRVRALRDPAILRIVSGAGLGCAVAL